MRIGVSGKSRLTIPIMGTLTASLAAFKFSTPSIRIPAAPPATEAAAIAATMDGSSIGPLSTGWQDAINPCSICLSALRFNSDISPPINNFQEFLLVEHTLLH